MEYDIDIIEKETEQTKKNLLKRKNMEPPMCQRLTMSVSSLLLYCDKVLFLCKKVKELEKDRIEEVRRAALRK